MKKNNEERIERSDLSDDSYNEVDYDDNENGTEFAEKSSNAQNCKMYVEKSVWNLPGWNINLIYEHGYQPYGPRMEADNFTLCSCKNYQSVG